MAGGPRTGARAARAHGMTATGDSSDIGGRRGTTTVGSRLRARLDPEVAAWFGATFGAFTEAQARCLPRILDRESVLLSSPTGTGKTLAAFLGILDGLVREARRGDGVEEGVRAVYVSPLRALTYDIRKNLEEPLRGLGMEDRIRIAMRTGDTRASERARMRRRPPHILLTTPESLAILLAQAPWREAFATCRFVVVDELHALVENKRGTHLSVSLERLERLLVPSAAVDGPGHSSSSPSLCRIGLSATVAPLGEVAGFLVGEGRACRIESATPARDAVVEVLSPLRRDPYPPAGFTGVRLVRDIADIVERNRSTIVFTNTRSGAENMSHRLKSALPALAHVIECHHGSLDRDLRLDVEDRLKNGELRAVVCSTSLELGIDIGFVDSVVMVSTPKGISRTLQRIGRSGHRIDRRSHGVLCATNINDLVECVVCARMAVAGRLDPVRLPGHAADVAVQHLLGMACAPGGVTRAEAFETLVRARPFRDLDRGRFDRLVEYLKGGGRSLERAYAERLGKIVEERPGGGAAGGTGAASRLRAASPQVEREYLVNVGTIHSEGLVSVYLGSRRRRLGGVEEGFLKGMRPGDTFVLAGRVVKLVETGIGEAFVEEARGLPSVPSWNANKMPLASGLAREVAAFRTALATQLEQPEACTPAGRAAVVDEVVENWLISTTNAEAIVRHFEAQLALSRVPVADRVLVEFHRGDPEDPDQAGLLHYFFHSLIGRSANDALSRILSRRVREAVGGNAMVTIDDYGFLLTLREFQQLGIDEWRELFRADGAREDLDRALCGSELVKWQFRGVAQTGLMVPRNRPGRERRLRELRWDAEILFRVLEEHEPDHPLLEEAYREAKHTFLDAERAFAFLEEAGSRPWDFVEVPVITPFSFGIFASKIREGMMMEDPEEAIERVYRRMAERIDTWRHRAVGDDPAHASDATP